MSDIVDVFLLQFPVWIVIDGIKHQAKGLPASIVRINANDAPMAVIVFTDPDLVSRFVATMKGECLFPFPLSLPEDLHGIITDCQRRGTKQVFIDPAVSKFSRMLKVETFLEYLEGFERQGPYAGSD